MKTLKELGVSPAPWSNTVGTEKPFEVNSVWDALNGGILTGGYAESVNDARLCAAAPDLYEACRRALVHVGKAPSAPEGWEVAAKLRAALEKAGGKE